MKASRRSRWTTAVGAFTTICLTAAGFATAQQDSGSATELAILNFEPQSAENRVYYLVQLRGNGASIQGDIRPSADGLLRAQTSMRFHISSGAPQQEVSQSYYFYHETDSTELFFSFRLEEVPLLSFVQSIATASSQFPSADAAPLVVIPRDPNIRNMSITVSGEDLDLHELTELISNVSGCSLVPGEGRLLLQNCH